MVAPRRTGSSTKFSLDSCSTSLGVGRRRQQTPLPSRPKKAKRAKRFNPCCGTRPPRPYGLIQARHHPTVPLWVDPGCVILLKKVKHVLPVYSLSCTQPGGYHSPHCRCRPPIPSSGPLGVGVFKAPSPEAGKSMAISHILIRQVRHDRVLLLPKPCHHSMHDYLEIKNSIVGMVPPDFKSPGCVVTSTGRFGDIWSPS